MDKEAERGKRRLGDRCISVEDMGGERKEGRQKCVKKQRWRS